VILDGATICCCSVAASSGPPHSALPPCEDPDPGHQPDRSRTNGQGYRNPTLEICHASPHSRRCRHPAPPYRMLRLRPRPSRLSPPSWALPSSQQCKSTAPHSKSRAYLSDAAIDAAADRMYAKIEPLREQIAAQPTTSLTALVDKAIVAARDCNPDGDWTGQPGIMALVQAVCGLAAVDPAEAMA
jgi:hypothetical protein